MALAEGLGRLPHLAALQVPDLHRQPLDGAGDDAEHREVHGVSVARNHLGRDRFRRKSHLLRDIFLDFGFDAREVTDRAGDGAGRDLLACRFQSLPSAGELGIVACELEPEAGGFGVNPVASADAERVLVLEGAALQCCRHGIDAPCQQGAGAIELHREAGVENIRRRETVMDEARLRPHVVREVGEEGDHVVAGLALDRVDLRGIDDGVLMLGDGAPERMCRIPRYLPEHGLRVERVALDRQPDGELGFGRPDRGHLRA